MVCAIIERHATIIKFGKNWPLHIDNEMLLKRKHKIYRDSSLFCQHEFLITFQTRRLLNFKNKESPTNCNQTAKFKSLFPFYTTPSNDKKQHLYFLFENPTQKRCRF